jgi:hypothetical protein
MSELRKLINIRLNDQPTTWSAMAGRYKLHYKSLYNKAQKSNKTIMAIDGDVIQWDVAMYESYFIIEGKRLETITELAKYLKVHKSTVGKILQKRGNKSFTYNNLSVKRVTKLKRTNTDAGVIDAKPLVQERKLFDYDTIEFAGHTFVRKLYVAFGDRVLMHTYGYEEGKQFLAL